MYYFLMMKNNGKLYIEIQTQEEFVAAPERFNAALFMSSDLNDLLECVEGLNTLEWRSYDVNTSDQISFDEWLKSSNQ